MSVAGDGGSGRGGGGASGGGGSMDCMISWEVTHSFETYNSGGSDGKSTVKPTESGSNSPTMAAATNPIPSKRTRNGVSKNKKAADLKETKGSESEHEIHIWTERERRKKMRNMFSSLHALLPQLPAKADKSTIVDEAVNYIKTLQRTLQKQQKRRLDMLRGEGIGFNASLMMVPHAVPVESREAFLADQGPSMDLAMANSDPSHAIPQYPHCFQTWSSPNVILSVSGDDAHISVCASKKPGLLVAIFYILEKHKLEVITIQISSENCRCMYMIHAHAKGTFDQLHETMALEEVYKQAVGEIILWLSS